MSHVSTDYIRAEINKSVPAEIRQQIEKIVDDNRGKAGSAIRVLQQVQGISGYLPPSVLQLVSGYTKIPLSELYGVVSFYSFFSLLPKGKHVIQVCMGTSCFVKGGEKIMKTLKKDYNLESGGITADGKFSLEMVRCLGCCGLSPVIAIDTDIHRKVKASQMKEILSTYK